MHITYRAGGGVQSIRLLREFDGTIFTKHPSKHLWVEDEMTPRPVSGQLLQLLKFAVKMTWLLIRGECSILTAVCLFLRDKIIFQLNLVLQGLYEDSIEIGQGWSPDSPHGPVHVDWTTSGLEVD